MDIVVGVRKRGAELYLIRLIYERIRLIKCSLTNQILSRLLHFIEHKQIITIRKKNSACAP